MFPSAVLALIRRFVTLKRSADVAFREAVSLAFARHATRARLAAASAVSPDDDDDVCLVDVMDEASTDGSIASVDSVASDASLTALRDHAAKVFWGTHALRPSQHNAVDTILRNSACGRRRRSAFRADRREGRRLHAVPPRARRREWVEGVRLYGDGLLVRFLKPWLLRPGAGPSGTGGGEGEGQHGPAGPLRSEIDGASTCRSMDELGPRSSSLPGRRRRSAGGHPSQMRRPRRASGWILVRSARWTSSGCNRGPRPIGDARKAPILRESQSSPRCLTQCRPRRTPRGAPSAAPRWRRRRGSWRRVGGVSRARPTSANSDRTRASSVD